MASRWTALEQEGDRESSRSECPNLAEQINYGSTGEKSYRTGVTNGDGASPELHGEACRRRCFELGLGRRARGEIEAEQRINKEETAHSEIYGWKSWDVPHSMDVITIVRSWARVNRFLRNSRKLNGRPKGLKGKHQKQIKVRSWFHSRSRTPDWNLVQIKLHVYDGKQRSDEKE